jgi:hypothetical protein
MSSSTHLNDAPEVALASQNIVVEGTLQHQEATGYHGCKMVVRDAGRLVMRGVQVRYCGQVQSSPALDIEFDTAVGILSNTHVVAAAAATASTGQEELVSVKYCSFMHLSDNAVLIHSASSRGETLNSSGTVTLEGNVFYNALGSAVVVDSGVHAIAHNLALVTGVGATKKGG